MADYAKMSDEDINKLVEAKAQALAPAVAANKPAHEMTDAELDLAVKAKLAAPKAPKVDPMSVGRAAAVKFQEGTTLGLRPVVAGAGAAMGDLYGQITGNQPFSVGQTKDAFLEARRDANAEQGQAQAEHPYVSTGANIAGSLLSAPLIGAGKGIQGAMKVGAYMGGAQAAGSADSVTDAVEKVGIGMGGGALGYAAAKTVGMAGSAALNSLAETKAFKASGAMLKDFRAAFGKDPDKINELGRTMLNNNLAQAGDSVTSIAQKSEGLRRSTGQKIGAVYEKVLDTLTGPDSPVSHDTVMAIQEAGFHPELQAEEMKTAVSQAFKGVPGSTAAINKAHTVIDELALNGNNITPDHALELKGHIDSMINWSKKAQDLPLDQDALKVVRNYIQNRLTTQVEAMDHALGSAQSGELVNLNKLYGNVSTIANIAKDRVLRVEANKAFGLTDTIMASGGLSAGAGLAHTLGIEGLPAGALALTAGAGAGLLNRGATKYGSAAIADFANRGARAVANPSTYTPVMSTTIKSGIGKK